MDTAGGCDARMDLPGDVLYILRTLEKAGHAAYVVGGCVRDALRGMTPGDYDIATSARPEETIACFPTMHVLKTGIKHGTVTILVDSVPYEVTTFRIDGMYSDHRRPDGVTFVNDIRGDLARRDFTVNAMAYGVHDELIDPFGGKEDLCAGVIRCVGDPAERFSEDALRILRAVRFVAQLGVHIDEATCVAMRAQRALLSYVAAERKFAELKKTLLAPYAAMAMERYGFVYDDVRGVSACGAASRNGKPSANCAWDSARDDVSSLARLPADLPVRLVAYGFGSVALHALKSDGETLRSVKTLENFADAPLEDTDTCALRLLSTMGADDALRLLTLRGADDLHARTDKLLAQDACYSISMLHVDGSDLIAYGVPEGREVGRVLEALLSEVIEGHLPNERDALLRRAREMMRDTKGENDHARTV